MQLLWCKCQWRSLVECNGLGEVPFTGEREGVATGKRRVFTARSRARSLVSVSTPSLNMDVAVGVTIDTWIHQAASALERARADLKTVDENASTVRTLVEKQRPRDSLGHLRLRTVDRQVRHAAVAVAHAEEELERAKASIRVTAVIPDPIEHLGSQLSSSLRIFSSDTTADSSHAVSSASYFLRTKQEKRNNTAD